MEQIIQCSSACVVTVRHELNIAGLNIDIPTAYTLGSGILLCWVIAACFRAIGNSVKPDEERET